MAPFDFKSDMHFVASSDKLTLHVYELNKTASANPSSIRKAHWSEVTIIVPGRNNDDDNDGEEEAKKYHDGLVFFDRHGEIQEQSALTKLAQELTRLRLMVNPEGYCYQDVRELGEHKDFGIHYLGLNDRLDWSRYGVDLVTTTVLLRSRLRYVMPKSGKQPFGQPQQKAGGTGATTSSVQSTEKLEVLKTEIKQKEKESEKLRKEKDKAERLKQAAEDKLQKLQDEKESEIQEIRDEKDKELVSLRKLKDEELRKLKKDKVALQKREKELLQKLSSYQEKGE